MKTAVVFAAALALWLTGCCCRPCGTRPPPLPPHAPPVTRAACSAALACRIGECATNGNCNPCICWPNFTSGGKTGMSLLNEIIAQADVWIMDDVNCTDASGCDAGWRQVKAAAMACRAHMQNAQHYDTKDHYCRSCAVLHKDVSDAHAMIMMVAMYPQILAELNHEDPVNPP
jgi:hypothetical protein